MGKYLDLYLLPIPKKHLAAYRKLAQAWGKLGRKHGMLEYWEAVSTTSNNPYVIPFKKVIKLKAGEVLISSVATFKSKAHRDRVVNLMANDPAMAKMQPKKPIFDMKRMVVGEFEKIVKL